MEMALGIVMMAAWQRLEVVTIWICTSMCREPSVWRENGLRELTNDLAWPSFPIWSDFGFEKKP